MTFGLTQRESEALHFLRAYKASHGIFPSFAEMAAGLRVKSNNTVTRLINGLEDKGRIRRLPNRARAIELIGEHPDVVFVNLDLPVAVQAQLTAFCEAQGEKPVDVLHDALVFHLDQMEVLLKREVASC